MLQRMGKPAKLATVRRGIEHVQAAGIPTHANFIVGFPGDRPENAERVVEFVDRWEVPFYSVSPWYCAPSTTITEERERYGIEGVYYDWKHASIDSSTAIELEQWMIQQPKRATYMSQLSTDQFWSEILLYSNGWSVDDVRQAARTFNRFAGRDTPAAGVRADSGVAALRATLERLPLADPAPLDRLAVAPA
jgi:radical SAM superfamily enzyme YgiQ (UPF0313 family)